MDGIGRVGPNSIVTIKLIPAQARALVFNLFYNDLPSYLGDQEKILNDGRFSHQEGEITRQPDDSGWRYKIEAVAYFTPPAAPDQAALLADLRDDRPSAQISEMSYAEWVFRLDPLEALWGWLRRHGVRHRRSARRRHAASGPGAPGHRCPRPGHQRRRGAHDGQRAVHLGVVSAQAGQAAARSDHGRRPDAAALETNRKLFATTQARVRADCFRSSRGWTCAVVSRR